MQPPKDPNLAELKELAHFLDKTSYMLQRKAQMHEAKRQSSAEHDDAGPSVAVLQRSDTLKRMTELLKEKSSRRDKAKERRGGNMTESETEHWDQRKSDSEPEISALDAARMRRRSKKLSRNQVRRCSVIDEENPAPALEVASLRGSAESMSIEMQPSPPSNSSPRPPEAKTEAEPIFLDLEVPQEDVEKNAILREIRLFWYALKREFNGENLDFDDYTASWGQLDWLSTFFNSNFQMFRSWGMLVLAKFCLLVACILIVTTSLSFYSSEGKTKYWLIYLTNWTLSMELLYFVLSFIATLKSAGWRRRAQTFSLTEQKMPLIVSVCWKLWAIVLPSSFLVAVIYWVIIFGEQIPNETYIYLSHGLNFALMVLDTCLVTPPFLLLHGLYLSLYGLLYMTWTLIFHKLNLKNAGGQGYIYPMVDWQDPGVSSKLSLTLVLVVLPLTVTVAWWISYLRERVVETRLIDSLQQKGKERIRRLSNATFGTLRRLSQTSSVASLGSDVSEVAQSKPAAKTTPPPDARMPHSTEGHAKETFQAQPGYHVVFQPVMLPTTNQGWFGQQTQNPLSPRMVGMAVPIPQQQMQQMQLMQQQLFQMQQQMQQMQQQMIGQQYQQHPMMMNPQAQAPAFVQYPQYTPPMVAQPHFPTHTTRR